MPEYRRPQHRVVASVLHAMDGTLLLQAGCYFGCGTQLAMAYGEYRESRDIDFLCSRADGYRMLREEMTERSLGQLMRVPIPLARDVRSDRDGVRTFFEVSATTIKFEILLEARLDLAGAIDRALGVPVLAVEHAIAEKLLANADRGLDSSTLSRDLIDLAFVAMRVDSATFGRGLALAEHAYGASVQKALDLVLAEFQSNRTRSAACIRSLQVDDAPTLRKGLRKLRALIG